MPEEDEPRQLSLGEIVWEILYREDDRPFIGLVVNDWSTARAWENVETGEYL